MKFTTNIPTTPGFYAWRAGPTAKAFGMSVIVDGGNLYTDGALSLTPLSVWSDGEWCRLVPAEEVKKAWDEASPPWKPWKDSRAKRIMEGKE